MTLFLPRHGGHLQDNAGADVATDQQRAEPGETVLIVDDEPTICMLVMDVGLPGGRNGRQVADAARALRPGLKILFITGYAESAAVGGTDLEAGMGVLAKPFAMHELANRIRALLGVA